MSCLGAYLVLTLTNQTQSSQPTDSTKTPELRVQTEPCRDQSHATCSDTLLAVSDASEQPPAAVLRTEDIYATLNRERTVSRKPALAINPLLEASACAKADHMITHDYWSHVAPDRTTPWQFIDEAGYPRLTAGENLAQGNYSAESVVAAWMRSSSHRRNILGDYVDTGICVRSAVRYQNRTTTLIVNHFGTQR